MAKYNYLPNDVIGTLYFANLDTHDRNGKYSFELGNLSNAAIDMLKQAGANVKSVDDDQYGRGEYVGVTSAYPYPIELDEGIELEEGKKIGNGTKAQVTFATYHHGRSHNNGIGLTALGKLLIKDLVIYDPEESGEDRPRREAV